MYAIQPHNLLLQDQIQFLYQQRQHHPTLVNMLSQQTRHTATPCLLWWFQALKSYLCLKNSKNCTKLNNAPSLDGTKKAKIKTFLFKWSVYFLCMYVTHYVVNDQYEYILNSFIFEHFLFFCSCFWSCKSKRLTQ